MVEQPFPTRGELEEWLAKDIARKMIKWGYPDEAEAARVAVKLATKVRLGPKCLTIDDYLAWLPEERKRLAAELVERDVRDAENQRRLAAIDAEYDARYLAPHGLTLEDDEDERCRGGCGLSRWDVLANMIMGCEGPDDD